MSETKVIVIPDGKICDYIDGKFRNDTPEEYVRLMNELNEAKLIAIAAQRMATFDSSKAIPASDVYKELGITEEDLSGFDEVEFE